MNAPVTTAGLLIVGGGPAAHHAAIAYREHGGPGPVLLVSDDDTPPYFRPPLSKELLRGGTDGPDLLLPGRTGAEVRTGRRVESLSVTDRLARLDDGGTVAFRQCLLATGSAAAALPVPGADTALYLRTLADARTLDERIGYAGSAIVVGSGFIGCEAAASLARRGLRVTVCSDERVPQAARLGDAVGDRLAGWLAEEGVTLRGGAEVTGIGTTASGRVVQLRDAEPELADVVLVAAGATPRAGLAADAGIAVRSGRVVVDERMRSSAPGVFAAGDVALAYNAAAGRHLAVEHWGEAEAMGTVAGTTAAGGDARWDSPPGFWTVIGDRTLKYTAWGDGFDEVALESHDGGGFTAWYRSGGVVCGVATHLADGDHERGTELVRRGATSTGRPDGR